MLLHLFRIALSSHFCPIEPSHQFYFTEENTVHKIYPANITVNVSVKEDGSFGRTIGPGTDL